MEKWKKIGRALLFPHMAVLWLLLPVAVVLLVYSMTVLGDSHPIAIVSYVLSAYTLTLWCCRIPRILLFFKHIKNENPFLRSWTADVQLRVRTTLLGSLLWNIAYGIFQLGLGLYHRSVWYYALAAYYTCLALMRFFLSRHMGRHKPGENMLRELAEYRTCGWIFLVINLALSAMVFIMIYQNRSTRHHPITTIALAAYTFTALTAAIVNTVRYRKYQSPVYSASKAISLAAACVSMISLTSTMLTSFSQGTQTPGFRTAMLAGLGAAVAVLITTMAVYMIVTANRQMKQLGESE